MEQFNINKGMTIKPGLDVLPPPVTDDEYRALMAGEDRYLMTESNTLEEIEATFFYDTPIHWCATDLLEAISSTRLQLHRTMQAFVRALNQKLNGTGISAGSDKTGDVAQSGARAIGGAEIGRARNVNGLPVLPAIIPLSDGQTISILFHSPTAENRITNSDTLVAFQFLLNKKDVTHTVAPMSGRDMTLAQVTMKLANLAEKNSAKFQRAQKKKKALVDEITQLQADSDQKEDAMSDLADQVAAVEGQKADLEQKINAVASEADSLYEENERLQGEIDRLNRTGGRDTIAPAGMTGGHSRALTDRLASIKNRMHMDGEATLSNGASMKQFIGDGEGYIQLSKDLRPAQLTDSGLSSHGAPIIGEDNAVESGNGRTMGIIKAYQDGNADRYREYLIDHATEFGIPPEKVESMTAPVLVRRRLTKVDRVQFAKDSNISDLQEMAASEKAFVDADSITPAMMALFNPSESGDLLSRSNDAFIRGFMTQVGATQAAGLVTEDGRPTRQLVDRIQNAIFAKAYKDARLVRMVAEEPDPDMRGTVANSRW